MTPAPIPGTDCGKYTRQKRRPVCRPKRFARPHIGSADGLHHRIKRQDHEGQQDMRHRNDRAELVVDH